MCFVRLFFGASFSHCVSGEKRVCPAWLWATIKGEKLFFIFLFVCVCVCLVTHCCQLSHTGDHHLVCLFPFLPTSASSSNLVDVFFFFLQRKISLWTGGGNSRDFLIAPYRRIFNFEFPALPLLRRLIFASHARQSLYLFFSIQLQREKRKMSL
jgi:hypothetical protein